MLKTIALVILILVGIPLSVWWFFNYTFQQADAMNVRNGVRQLRLLAETAYDGSGGVYKDWTKSPLVQDDVETLVNAMNSSLGSAQSRAAKVVIVDSRDKEYCISVPVDDINHYCVDATGVFQDTTQPCQRPASFITPLVCPD